MPTENAKLSAFFPILRSVARTPFLVLDFIGVILIVVGGVGQPALDGITLSGWASAFLTTGSTLITLGLSLPVAIYFQSEHNTSSFDLLRACTQAGIQRIFVNRKLEKERYNRVTNQAATTTRSLNLIGVSFRGIFSPDKNPDSELRRCVTNPKVRLKIALLDQQSDAAKRRAMIETEGPIQEDIHASLTRGIPSIVATRIKESDIDVQEILEMPDQEEAIEKAIGIANIRVMLFDHDPIAFVTQFDECLFVEQYHFGRTNEVPIAGCIGGYLPIVQYAKGSNGYEFLAEHLNYVFSNSKNGTRDAVKRALEFLKASG